MKTSTGILLIVAACFIIELIALETFASPFPFGQVTVHAFRLK